MCKTSLGGAFISYWRTEPLFSAQQKDIAKLAISYFIQLNKERTLEYEHICSDLSKYDQINPKLVQKLLLFARKTS